MKTLTGSEALHVFHMALTISAMAVAGWFRKGSADEDEMVADSHDMILDAVADADLVREIDLETGENLRDQVTVEQAIEMHRESELRRFGWRRN